MIKILFICTGNTCRSPMAEGILKDKIAKCGKNDVIRVVSAGLSARPGDRPSPNAVAALSKEGVDISAHRARRLDLAMLKDSDLALTMTARQRDMILQAVPDMRERVFTFSEYLGEAADIVDPFGADLPIYEDCAVMLRSYIDMAWPNFLQQASSGGK